MARPVIVDYESVLNKNNINLTSLALMLCCSLCKDSEKLRIGIDATNDVEKIINLLIKNFSKLAIAKRKITLKEISKLFSRDYLKHLRLEVSNKFPLFVSYIYIPSIFRELFNFNAYFLILTDKKNNLALPYVDFLKSLMASDGGEYVNFQFHNEKVNGDKLSCLSGSLMLVNEISKRELNDDFAKDIIEGVLAILDRVIQNKKENNLTVILNNLPINFPNVLSIMVDVLEYESEKHSKGSVRNMCYHESLLPILNFNKEMMIKGFIAELALIPHTIKLLFSRDINLNIEKIEGILNNIEKWFERFNHDNNNIYSDDYEHFLEGREDFNSEIEEKNRIAKANADFIVKIEEKSIKKNKRNKIKRSKKVNKEETAMLESATVDRNLSIEIQQEQQLAEDDTIDSSRELITSNLQKIQNLLTKFRKTKSIANGQIIKNNLFDILRNILENQLSEKGIQLLNSLDELRELSQEFALYNTDNSDLFTGGLYIVIELINVLQDNKENIEDIVKAFESNKNFSISLFEGQDGKLKEFYSVIDALKYCEEVQLHYLISKFSLKESVIKDITEKLGKQFRSQGDHSAYRGIIAKLTENRSILDMIIKSVDKLQCYIKLQDCLLDNVDISEQNHRILADSLCFLDLIQAFINKKKEAFQSALFVPKRGDKNEDLQRHREVTVMLNTIHNLLMQSQSLKFIRERFRLTGNELLGSRSVENFSNKEKRKSLENNFYTDIRIPEWKFFIDSLMNALNELEINATIENIMDVCKYFVHEAFSDFLTRRTPELENEGLFFYRLREGLRKQGIHLTRSNREVLVGILADNPLDNLRKKLFKKKAYSSDYYEGEAKHDGSCFFDSFRQGLEQQKGIKVTVNQLRKDCREFAGNNPPQWFKIGIFNSFEFNTENNHGFEEDYGKRSETVYEYISNIMRSDRWGDPEVDGRVLCQKYGVKVHVIEVNPIILKFINYTKEQIKEMRDEDFVDCIVQNPFLHQLISGEKVININDDNNIISEHNVIHMINMDAKRFNPVFKIAISQELESSRPLTLLCNIGDMSSYQQFAEMR